MRTKLAISALACFAALYVIDRVAVYSSIHMGASPLVTLPAVILARAATVLVVVVAIGKSNGLSRGRLYGTSLLAALLVFALFIVFGVLQRLVASVLPDPSVLQTSIAILMANYAVQSVLCVASSDFIARLSVSRRDA
jgi:uncharacterized membrane protein